MPSQEEGKILLTLLVNLQTASQVRVAAFDVSPNGV
jgi:hypothetical protein